MSARDNVDDNDEDDDDNDDDDKEKAVHMKKLSIYCLKYKLASSSKTICKYVRVAI